MSGASELLRRLAESAEGLLTGGYLLVEDGEGFEELPDSLPLRSGASARVVKVTTELGLRHALWKAGPAAVIAVVPGDLDLPADLRQGAERRRIHTMSGDEVLSALLGTRVTGIDDAALRELAMAHIDQIQARLHAKTTPTVIDRALLERTLVEVVAELSDLRSEGQASELLARWIAAEPAWVPAVQRLAGATLAQQHGDTGRVLAWALEGKGRLRALVVYGALLGVEGEVPAAAWGPLAALDDGARSPLRAPALARATVVKLAGEAATHLGHGARPLLDEADSLARKMLPSGQLQTSALLPLAFDERAHAIAVRLGRAEAVPREELRALRAHALAGTARGQLELLDDMDRLVRYLRHLGSPPQNAARIAESYLADHAHADQCARRLERTLASVHAHHAEARALLERVHAARDALNLAYATALRKAYVSTLFDHGLVALQNLTRDVVAERMAKDAGRVFLLVLDGCSVPVFVDLLEQLTDPAHRIGLERRSGMALRLDCGISPLPTITSHARGALFLGAIPHDPFAAETQWRDEGERTTDPARFRQNKALANVERKLFLKGDLADGGMGLQTALKGPMPLVAAVFNAVDDRIGSHDTGAAWRMQVEDVTGLLPALQAALDTGRKVLVTADHGHTPFRGTALRVSAGSTPRYARLKAGEDVPDGFVEVDCGDLAGEPGRTAFAWRSGVYRGQVQVGFHGGCSLEEMVVPVAWLARDGMPADRPGWWHEAGVSVSASPARPVVPVAPAPIAVAGAPVEKLPAALREILDAGEQAAVACILAEGPIRTSVLAGRLQRPPGRLPGYLAKLNQKLAAHGVRLDGEVLPDHEQQWRYR